MFLNKIKNNTLQTQPIFLLNGEVIWQASDSSLNTKEFHGLYVVVWMGEIECVCVVACLKSQSYFMKKAVISFL